MPVAVKASASDYTLTEIEDFLENAARLDWSPQGDWIAYDIRVEGDPDYDPLYDLDGNGVIDIVDIMLVAVHWGESCAEPTSNP